MGLAVVLSGVACYQQVAPTELDKNVRPPEKCEMRIPNPARVASPLRHATIVGQRYGWGGLRWGRQSLRDWLLSSPQNVQTPCLWQRRHVPNGWTGLLNTRLILIWQEEGGRPERRWFLKQCFSVRMELLGSAPSNNSTELI